MAKKTLDRTVQSVWVRRVPKGKKQVIHEYWVSSWRDRDGKIVNAHLGAVTKVTEAEALQKALILKTASVGPLVERQIIQPSTGHGMQPVEDVAKIKAEREAFIAEWVEDVVHSPADTCYKMEPHGWMLCNACGADFRAYPSEARHCPTCTSSDIREMTDRERDFDTRYCRIEDGIYAIKHIRDEPIAEMLKSLRAKKTAATLEIKEGWIDANPENRLELHLRENDNYCWITRCGDWWMTGYEAAGEASDGLVRHCKTCIGEQGAKRKSRCWMSADEWRAVQEAMKAEARARRMSEIEAEAELEPVQEPTPEPASILQQAQKPVDRTENERRPEDLRVVQDQG